MIEERHTPAPETAIVAVKLMADTPPNSTVFVLGATGCGKTTLIANLLLERVDKGERIIILDTKDEYDTKFFAASGVKVSDWQGLATALNNRVSVIVYSFSKSYNFDETCEKVMSTIYEFQRRNSTLLPPVTIAMDELNRFVDSHCTAKGISDVVERGRAFKIKKLFGAQWFNGIPTWMRESFTEIYCYTHTDPNGLRMLEVYGFDSEDLRTLPKHTVLCYAKGRITQIKLQPKQNNE